MTAPERMPPAANVTFDAAGCAHAEVYDDVYFSRDGGLAETQAVFLDGCDLPGLWAGRGSISIGELGFGAGLNALAVWRLWRDTRPPGAVLHFTSVEGFPLSRAHAARALAPFEALAPLATQLLQRWPVRAYGPQRLWFPEDGFALTVLLGQAQPALHAFEGPVDAWFLDGFSPARNPQMWASPVLERIAALSRPGARLASYTAAGAVRRALADSGWEIERRPGFGRKKHRIIGRFRGVGRMPRPIPSRVAVVGGGIAGACLAHALSRRSVAVQMLVAGPSLADAASGNPAGLVMPRLDRGPGALPELHRAAFLAAVDLYRHVAPGAFAACGVAQRPDCEREAAAFADLLANPPLPSDHLRADEAGALRHVAAGVLQPVKAIAALTAGLTPRCGAPVAALSREGGLWRLFAADGVLLAETESVIIAAGAGIAGLSQTRWLPVALSRGQIELAVGCDPHSHALTQGAYLAPTPGGVVFGASFAPTPQTAVPPEVTWQDRQDNVARLARLDPALAASLDEGGLISRAAYRATTSDRAPIAGRAPDAAAWAEGRHGTHHVGLWMLGGLGARGLTLAPLLAEALASDLLDEPSPLSAAHAAAISPDRFLRRAVKRGETIRA